MFFFRFERPILRWIATRTSYYLWILKLSTFDSIQIPVSQSFLMAYLVHASLWSRNCIEVCKPGPSNADSVPPWRTAKEHHRNEHRILLCSIFQCCFLFLQILWGLWLKTHAQHMFFPGSGRIAPGTDGGPFFCLLQGILGNPKIVLTLKGWFTLIGCWVNEKSGFQVCDQRVEEILGALRAAGAERSKQSVAWKPQTMLGTPWVRPIPSTWTNLKHVAKSVDASRVRYGCTRDVWAVNRCGKHRFVGLIWRPKVVHKFTEWRQPLGSPKLAVSFCSSTLHQNVPMTSGVVWLG